ncbi:MAG: glycosyltransferase family 4 protein [Hungatella sp.]|jgi:glycosyltransferase involved in cell wall biosynthesis|nr:glycosyltransferase family 4 protein [Hungatella sp.]
MKILYLTNIPSPYRVDFFNELGKYCELTVLFERKSAGDRDKRWKIDEFKYFRYIFLKGKNIGQDASLCPGVVSYLKREYDAIILGGYSSPTYMIAIDYMQIRGIPFFLNADGGSVKGDSRLRYLIKRHYIGSASAWLSTGERTNQYLMYYGARREAIYHYPFTSVREAELYCPDKEEKNKNKEQILAGNKKIILSVGRFLPLKGIELLIKASGQLCGKADVYIVGGKPDEAYLRLQREQGASNVHFIDFMEKEKLRAYYLAADVFVFPTLDDVWGLVLNEAMSFGLPCVTSKWANASHELTEDGKDGYLIDPRDVNDMAEKLELLIADDQLRSRMGERAYEKIKNFTIEKMAERHRDIIKGGIWKCKR